jgi:NADPH-dependent glutamate synthase beta subunit-like oxidoreductase
MDSPIRIAALQRFACDHAEYIFEIDTERKTNKKVAIIGAGPAGISCALQLRTLGYDVEIFEKEKFVTGTIAREIPEFKVPRKLIEKELNELEIDKIKIHFGMEVSRDFLEKEISKEYDAVFLGVGLNKSKRGELNKKNLKNVYDASAFLNSVKNRIIRRIKGICVAIGGGDTAIDCARAALRLGAERTVVAYRRSKKEMPASEAEFMQAGKEGVEFLWQISPVRLKGQKKVAEIEFIRNELVRSKPGERKKFREISGTEFKFPADVVVFALGKDRDEELTSILGQGRKTINPDTLQIENTQYFAGGDFVNWGKTVVEAVAHGKRAAFAIDRYLKSL